MRRFAIPVALLACGCAPAPPPATAPAPTHPALTAEPLRRDLFAFADDSFRGREAGTRNEFRAARFLAERLAAIDGIVPAGDSGYYQRVPLVSRGFSAASRIVVTTGRQTHVLPLGAQALPLLTLGPGAPLPRLEADGDLVFAGYGTIPQLRRDDLANLDVAGKVVVVVNDAPAGADSALRETLQAQPMLGERLGQLIPRGPAAIIVLLGGEFGEQFADNAGQLLTQLSRPQDDPAATDGDRRLPMILLAVAQPGSPLLPAGWPANDRPQPLTGRRFTARVEIARSEVTSYNVIGVVRGTDPALAQTYVAYGSHLDHIGIQPPVNGDSVANGADDNASGSATMLALARAFAGSPARPRRSLLFVWHGAEEKGLLGSAHFTQQPTVPIDSIVAQLNADMIGRNHPDSIFIVGPRAAPGNQSRVLGAILDSVNAAQQRPFAVNREWDSPTHPERIYYRSDHYNYAARGIPILFFTTGLHDDYHRVTDTPDKIDYEKLARVGRLLHEMGIAVGNRATRPR